MAGLQSYPYHCSLGLCGLSRAADSHRSSKCQNKGCINKRKRHTADRKKRQDGVARKFCIGKLEV